MTAQNLEETVVEKLAGPCGVRRGDAVLVCVSGGIDSMVLLHVMGRVSDRLGMRLGVFHAEHGLRGEESRADAEFVARAGRAMGLPVHVVSLGMEAGAPNVEEEARARRYGAVTMCMRANGYVHAATAHTMDDQAETVLYRVVRGTGVRGLAGMRYRRPDGVIRPLLGVTRTEIERYARAEGVESRDDRTNKDTSRARNLIRLEVMPLLLRINPAAVKAMASLAAIAGEEGAVLEELAADAAAVASVARGSLLRAYALDRLQAVCAPVLKRMLIDTVAQVDRGMRGMAMKQVNMLVGVVEGKAAAHEIGRRVRVCSTGGLLCVHRIARPPYYALSLSDAGPCEVFVPETGWTVRVRVPVACPEGRVLRSWMPGDRVRGHKAAGIMAGLGVPEALRPFWPVLATGGCLAAVAEGDPKTGGLVLGRGS